ncbi:HAD-IIB family hydrolase [Mucilaginibacter sp. UR6-11]|uniref:HAD-IIB family hydrolase n=1 Tax=Mucilaginibacter sp. UR6-11 TaxID=1435644 RepID=UPI001E34229C|nr:HAD-IIB family hydrolase [Mucilaginibacter sp. UR6-11]MCC8426415.1 HAD-IIB family hydrolase [Mucilaginibacter sp. UR6-11]
MRYLIFTTDYDGTLASNDHVTPLSLQALARLKATGRKLILVTGRQLEELKSVFPEYPIFDRIVAENGALIYQPATLELKLLGERPPENFLDCLRRKNVPFSAGHVIVATWEPHHHAVLEAIKETGAEYQLIFNKGAVMVLPPAVNKATGLREALKELEQCLHNVVAIGDAENDNAMLQAAECAIAVSNALPAVKAVADWTTGQPAGEGVTELINRLIDDDLAGLDQQLSRHYLEIGLEMNTSPLMISPYGSKVLLAGPSGFGKTTLTAAFMEKLIAKQYQFCLIDPEGDYQDFPGVINIGNSIQPPAIDHIIDLLAQPEENIAVCILAIALEERPDFFRRLLTAIIDLRTRTGHPHFLILDEAHHLLPAAYAACYYNMPDDFTNFFAVTTQPRLLCSDFLRRVNIALLMGEAPDQAMQAFSSLTEAQIVLPDNLVFQKGDILVWQQGNTTARLARGDMPSRVLMRHKRKYASGDMHENSFFFTGPSRRLNLKANNLMLFIQIGRGIDDETWLFHLHRHDYSKWFRYAVKDEKLAMAAAHIEDQGLNAEGSRQAIFHAILERYTAPA